jgi:hypothetical protein
MRPRDTTDATRAALAMLGYLADALPRKDAIDEVPPEQREQAALSRAADKAVAAAESTRGKEQSARLNQAKSRKAARRAKLWVRRDKKLQEEFRQNRMESSDLAIRIRRLRHRYKTAPSAKSLGRYLK